MTSSFSLPPNFESLALSKFDHLLKNNRILYQPPEIDIVDVDNIQVTIFPLYIA